MADKPPVVTSLAQDVSDLALGSIKFSWAPASASTFAPVTGYVVYKDGGAGIFFPVATELSTSFAETGLPHGAAVNYKIAARNIAGEGPMSDPVTVYAGVKPCEVQNLKITAQSKTNLAISWEAPTCAQGLQIQRYLVVEDNADFVF